jgi:transposase
MRYELSDYEGAAIKLMLPSKPRGVRRTRSLELFVPASRKPTGRWIGVAPSRHGAWRRRQRGCRVH